MIKLDRQGGTVKSTRASHPEASITTAQVLGLAQLLEQVEGYYKKPADIEWAGSTGKLSLL